MLEVRGVDAGYTATQVLRGVDIAIPPASVVALIGANGAGKTTLVRVLSGLLRPWSGSVVLDGEDVTGRPAHELAGRGVCHVAEGRAIFRSLDVRDNLLLFAARTRERDVTERAAEAFPVLGARLHQTAGTLSGGEQQMLALARAYVTQPRFVLLDEPSMGLAPKIVDEVFDFVERLRNEGVALLLIEQFVDRALALADYVFILERGRVAFAGEPGEIDEETLVAHYYGDADAARPSAPA